MKTFKLLGKLFILASILCFASCNDDDEFNNRQYELQSIQWKLTEGEQNETYQKEFPKEVIKNDKDQSIYHTHTDSTYVSSQFFCDNPALLSELTGDSIEVCIPIPETNLSSAYSILFSSVSSSLAIGKIVLPVSGWSSDKLEIPPHTQLAFTGTLSFTKVKASYRLIFREKNSNEIIEVTGKWEGEYSVGTNITYTSTPIK